MILNQLIFTFAAGLVGAFAGYTGQGSTKMTDEERRRAERNWSLGGFVAGVLLALLVGYPP